jgi:hypothetical protein
MDGLTLGFLLAGTTIVKDVTPNYPGFLDVYQELYGNISTENCAVLANLPPVKVQIVKINGRTIFRICLAYFKAEKGVEHRLWAIRLVPVGMTAISPLFVSQTGTKTEKCEYKAVREYLKLHCRPFQWLDDIWDAGNDHSPLSTLLRLYFSLAGFDKKWLNWKTFPKDLHITLNFMASGTVYRAACNIQTPLSVDPPQFIQPSTLANAPPLGSVASTTSVASKPPGPQAGRSKKIKSESKVPSKRVDKHFYREERDKKKWHLDDDPLLGGWEGRESFISAVREEEQD